MRCGIGKERPSRQEDRGANPDPSAFAPIARCVRVRTGRRKTWAGEMIVAITAPARHHRDCHTTDGGRDVRSFDRVAAARTRAHRCIQAGSAGGRGRGSAYGNAQRHRRRAIDHTRAQHGAARLLARRASERAVPADVRRVEPAGIDGAAMRQKGLGRLDRAGGPAFLRGAQRALEVHIAVARPASTIWPKSRESADSKVAIEPAASHTEYRRSRARRGNADSQRRQRREQPEEPAPAHHAAPACRRMTR